MSTESNQNELTEYETEVIRALQHRGFAVIVWNPDELGEANPRRVEDRSVELGWQVIGDLGGPSPDGDDDNDEPHVAQG